MKKYIDAEKLIVEIDKKWKELADKNVKVGGGKYDAEISTYLSIKNLVTSLQQERPEVDLVAELKHHLATTPKEQLEKEWKELEPWGNIGPTIQEFLYGKQPEEQPEYGYLSTEYVPGRKPKWNVGDVLAYYISTSNEEGEYPLGKIVNVEFDEEEGWIYTFEDESMWDEPSLFEEGAYRKN